MPDPKRVVIPTHALATRRTLEAGGYVVESGTHSEYVMRKDFPRDGEASEPPEIHHVGRYQVTKVAGGWLVLDSGRSADGVFYQTLDLALAAAVGLDERDAQPSPPSEPKFS